MAKRSPHRDALRLLYILIAGSSALPEHDASGAVAVFKGETRLYAFDFWMRNPDYFAEELLDLFEATREGGYLGLVKEIFRAEEPDIRRFPMIRYRFGAYERLDDTLSILVSRKLLKITGIKDGARIRETDFLLMQPALDLARQIVEDHPGLAWYANRAGLVARLAGERGGTALKSRQYDQIEYAETQMGGTIPSIKSRVQQRLNALMANGG